MLQVNNLSFDYADNPLLRNIHFCVPAGKLLHVRGENGSGKTTLLKLLAGILTPADGEICFHSNFILQHKMDYQRQLCYIGHKAGISDAFTLRENCFFDLRRGGDALEMDKLASTLLLTGLEDVPCGRLSAGQRRRVAFARLLVSDAKLWLLDEPLIALDEQTMLLFMTLTRFHLEKGGSIVLTSHQPLPCIGHELMEYYL